MNPSTRRLLLEVNRRFYDQYADSFGQTRSRPWPAWQRLLDGYSPALKNIEEPIRILDAGCGNGRFGLLATQCLGRPVLYEGWDQSEGLLRQARDKMSKMAESSFHVVDLSSSSLVDRPMDDQTFHIIGIFGVLHHLPGEAERRRLLSFLGSRLVPGGEMWASWWMLHHTERFEKKLQSWDRIPEIYQGLQAPKGQDLEPGDQLLSWQKDGLGLRYLHFPTAEELLRLQDLPGLTFVGDLNSDGPTGQENLYLRWRPESSVSEY